MLRMKRAIYHRTKARSLGFRVEGFRGFGFRLSQKLTWNLMLVWGRAPTTSTSSQHKLL